MVNGATGALSYSTPGSSRSASYVISSLEELERYILGLQNELAFRGIGAQARRRRFAIGVRF